MKIQQILSQHRHDFQAIYVCEHCGWTKVSHGYDDDNSHKDAIPNMPCGDCEKTADGQMTSSPVISPDVVI